MRAEPEVRRRARFVAVLLGLALLLTACNADSGAGDRAVAIDVTFEEAALVSLGEMFRRYPDGADPLPVRVTGAVVDLAGGPAWRLDATYAVTVGGVRRTDAWTLWVVPGEGGQPEVVRADGPPGVASP